MSLDIYLDEAGTALSKGGAFTTPFLTTADGRVGRIVETKLYVRADQLEALDVGYTLIVVTAIDPAGASRLDGATTGFGMKLFEGADQPSQADWDSVNYVDLSGELSMSDIPSASILYYPFWVRQEVPAGRPIQVISNITFRLTSTATTTP